MKHCHVNEMGAYARVAPTQSPETTVEAVRFSFHFMLRQADKSAQKTSSVSVRKRSCFGFKIPSFAVPDLAGKYLVSSLKKQHPDFGANNEAGNYQLDGGLLPEISHDLHPILPMRKSVIRT